MLSAVCAARTQIIAESNEHVSTTANVGSSLRVLIILLRWLRAARIALVLVRANETGRKAARQQTGGNKRRYVDLDNGFDLDLVYVLPQLIGACRALRRADRRALPRIAPPSIALPPAPCRSHAAHDRALAQR